MAKDDYDVVVFKILMYLYACMKRKITFDIDTFNATISKNSIDEGYLADILRMMSEESLIQGYKYKLAWGGNIVILSAMDELKITSAGIRYVENNSKMKQLKEFFLSQVGNTPWVTGLLRLIGF